MMNHIKLGSITQPDKRTLILIGQYNTCASVRVFSKATKHLLNGDKGKYCTYLVAVC